MNNKQYSLVHAMRVTRDFEFEKSHLKVDEIC